MHSVARGALARLYDAPAPLLVLTMLFWAGNSVIGRYAAGHVPPVALVTLRWIGAALILAAVALPYVRADWPNIVRHIGTLAWLSLLGVVGFNALTYYGLHFTEAINSTILQSVGPLMIVGWTFLLFGERLRLRQLAGMLLSLAGIAVVVSRGDPRALLDLRLNVGDLLLLAAIASYALYSALLKRSPKIHPMSFVAVTIVLGAIMLLPAYALEIAAGQVVPLDGKSALIVGYVIVFPSLLAHFFFYRGVELIGPNRASPFIFLTPVFTAVLAILFLGEELHLFHGLGFALVIGGVLLATRAVAAAPAAIKP